MGFNSLLIILKALQHNSYERRAIHNSTKPLSTSLGDGNISPLWQKQLFPKRSAISKSEDFSFLYG